MKTMSLLVSTLFATQTLITPPENKYTPAQDVEIGQKAAAEVRQQLPILRDDLVTSYVEEIGRRLVAAIPPELQHREFRYAFEVVNVREINAFALPGGPMFVNRGMIEAAHSEGEVAGVMAHEMSHVALRHGTAQATKATPYEIGEVAGAILGSIVGGTWGRVISQGTQFGIGTYFLRFSREFEQQADLEGTHIMARAGYDPIDMANMFRTIEKQGGSGAPQWLSDHPDPGNRIEYITAEARSLRVERPVRDTRSFENVQARLRRMSPAPTTEEATKNGNRPVGTSGDTRTPIGRIEPPSADFRTYEEGNAFRVSVPSNWRELAGSSAVTFAPDGAYGSANGQSVFTHGMEIGIARNETHDLQRATEELIDSLARGNQNLRRTSGFDRIKVDGRPGLRTLLSNTSEATGQPETVEVFSAQMPDGTLLYAIGVAPTSTFSSYRNVFDRIVSSIRTAG
jgi:Zn-dependent protease with chaperone function